MRKYETVGGVVTRGETIAKLTDLLREAEECCYVVSHLHRAEDGHKDELLATGWRGIGQLLERTRAQIIELEKGRLQ